MGLSWINPLYLLASLLLVIPVLIHLIQRHRAEGIKFPSLMFLQQIRLHEKRQFRIRHWWLMLLRCLLLFLIVLAFARPFLDQSIDSGNLQPGSRDSVIVLDRSYSMQLGDRWRQAQDIALELVDRKAPKDRIALLVVDDNTELVNDFTADGKKLHALIKRQQAGLKTTLLNPGLEQAARLLSSSNTAEKYILLISDFQAARERVPVISRDIQLETYAVDTGQSSNAAISALSIKPSAGSVFSLNVDVSNRADAELQQQIELSLNGRELPARRIRLDTDQVITENFDNISSAEDLVRGIVSLGDDAFALDNQAYFVYSGTQEVPVLIVDSASSRLNQFIYLEDALRLSRKPGFEITRLQWQDLEFENLHRWRVIIINDLSIPGGETGNALQQFVEAGGGLLLASGETDQINWPDFMPGTLLSKVYTRAGESHRLSGFEVNRFLANGTDLSDTLVFAYRKLETTARDRVLGRYNNGDIALIERISGAGRVLVLSTTLDTHWNDLALQPEFLPFMHRVMNYLSAYESYPDQFEVGEVVDVIAYARALTGSESMVKTIRDSPLLVETPGGREVQLSRQSPMLNLNEPGFYQVHRAIAEDDEVVLAVNINPAETRFESLDVARFVEEIRTAAEPSGTGAVLTQRQAAASEHQQQLWYAILILVLITMLVEAFFANWIVRKRPLEG